MRKQHKEEPAQFVPVLLSSSNKATQTLLDLASMLQKPKSGQTFLVPMPQNEGDIVVTIIEIDPVNFSVEIPDEPQQMWGKKGENK